MNASSQSLRLHDEQWRAVVAAAGAAPSTHNTQPWRFVVEPDAIHLHLDPSRALPVIDPTGREARISCGAALLNLRLALRALDLEPVVTLLPQRRHATLLATARLTTLKPATPDERLARQMANAFLSIGNANKAVGAQEMVTQVEPTQQTFANLAIFAYQAGQTRKGDLAAGKAVDLAPKDEQKDLKTQLDSAKTQALTQQLQQAAPSATPTVGG